MCFQDHYIGMTQRELISGNAIFLTTPIEQKEKCEIQNFCIRDCSFYRLFSCDKANFLPLQGSSLTYLKFIATFIQV